MPGRGAPRSIPGRLRTGWPRPAEGLFVAPRPFEEVGVEHGPDPFETQPTDQVQRPHISRIDHRDDLRDVIAGAQPSEQRCQRFVGDTLAPAPRSQQIGDRRLLLVPVHRRLKRTDDRTFGRQSDGPVEPALMSFGPRTSGPPLYPSAQVRFGGRGVLRQELVDPWIAEGPEQRGRMVLSQGLDAGPSCGEAGRRISRERRHGRPYNAAAVIMLLSNVRHSGGAIAATALGVTGRRRFGWAYRRAGACSRRSHVARGRARPQRPGSGRGQRWRCPVALPEASRRRSEGPPFGVGPLFSDLPTDPFPQLVLRTRTIRRWIAITNPRESASRFR